MLHLLEPKFQYLHQENPYVDIMHVHLSNGKSFLRVHKPLVYGDDIAKKRAMLREIHKHHKLIRGYETGLYFTVYRVIAPIFNKKGRYIGAIEIGIDPNFIVDIIHKINGFCGVVFIKANQLKLYSQPNKMFIDGYKLQSKLNTKLTSICNKFKTHKALKNNILLIVKGKQYLTHLITLKNFNKKEDSVKIVFFQDITNIDSFFKNFTYKFYLLILSVFLLLSYLIYRRISFYQDEVEKIYLQTEKEISFNQEYLQAIFDVTPYMMITTDGNNIDKANPAMLEFFHYNSLEEFQAEHDCICDYFIGDNDCLVSQINGIHWLNYILENPKKLHKACMNKDGKRHHFIVQAHLLHIDSKKRSIVVFNDITNTEELNERLELAVSGTNDGLWDWNLENGTVYFSPRWKEMLGYKDDELPNMFETWASRVHPDDLEEANKKIKICHANPDIEYNHTHRLRHKNGSWVWILDRGQTIFNAEGKAIRMVGFHTDITRQKELEEKLLASQHQFEQFMKFIPAHILIKENKKIVYANDSAKDFFHKENILGKTSQELLPKKFKEKIESFEKEVFLHGMHEEIFELVDINNQKKIYRKMAFLIDDNQTQKVGMVFIDITQEYQLNKEISKLLSAFERSDISVLMTDSEGTIEYVNPSWSKVTGYSHNELIGANPRIVKSGAVAPEVYEKMWKQLKNGKVWNSEIKNKAKDGTEFWEDSTIIPSFDKNGVVDGYVSFKLLINEKIKLQEELRNQEELMIAQSRHAAMGEMISMIAHQWRQPISVIAMDANNVLVDIELDSIETSSLKNDVLDILEQTKNLSQTIDDFRNFFKPNKIKDEVLVQDIYMESYRVIDKSLANNDIEVEHTFHSNTKIKIFSRELLQVFINILNNAKEALQEKNIKNKKIIINIKETKTSIIIEISDNAGGIDTNIIEKIFDPYFSTKNEKNGTGLGLYMSKIIIEKHLFGKLSVTNREDGSCFTIELPKVGESDD
jgi:PAS domain S-box-containing protein